MTTHFQNGLHRLPVRVYYEDTDFSGAVYHASYLRFAERGRSEFLHGCGIRHADLFNRPVPLAFSVAKMDMVFKAPARIGDMLEVVTAFVSFHGARIGVKQAILLEEKPVWQSDVQVACITARGRPVRLPGDVGGLLEPHVSGADNLPDFLQKP